MIEPWGQRLLLELSQDKHVDLTTIIKLNRDTSTDSPKNFLLSAAAKFEKNIFAKPVPTDRNAFKNLLQKTKSLLETHSSEISALKLDLIIDLDGGGNQKLASFAKHGVWYTDISAIQHWRAGFWPAAGKDPVSTICLLSLVEDNNFASIIAKAVVNSKFVATRNALFMKEKSIALLRREIRLLSLGLKNTKTISAKKGKRYESEQVPNTLHYVKYQFRVLCKLFERAEVKVFSRFGFRPNMFSLRVGEGNVMSFDLNSGAKINPIGNNYWADPFLWKRGNQTFCFFENYSYETKLGSICVGQLEDGALVDVRKIMITDYHMSFPFLFEEKGELFMMPETSNKRRLELWQCTNYPYEWKLHSTALTGVNAADSIILNRDNERWLFTNIASDVYGDNCSELHIFRIDGPGISNLTPHLSNPVVFNSRTARNAGKFHRIDGKILRPSQDNAFGQYGYGLNIMEMKELSLETYREENISALVSNKVEGIASSHHFDSLGSQFIVDVFKKLGGRPG